MSTTALPKVYHHPVSGETASQVLQTILPYSLPLYNRLQFHHRSPSSHILATFPPSDEPTNEAKIPKCFSVAFIDRSRRPETECWIFLSSEVPSRCSPGCQSCKSAVLAVVHGIAQLDVPDSIHDLAKLSTGNPLLSHATDTNIMLLGAFHELPKQVLEDEGLLAIGHPGIDIPYMNYLFQPSTLPESKELPEGLRWGAVRSQDFDLVRSRTQIPRQNATLALLPSLAIFPKHDDKAPIAWAFLGTDASLTSLHTEEEYRGKGLAKILAGKIFGEGGFESEEGPPGEWFHADVALDNASSRRVCKSLGGSEGWIVYWVRVDLAKARELRF